MGKFLTICGVAVLNRQVVATTCCDLTPGFEDWRSLLGRNFGEYDRVRSTPLDERLSARCANISHPFRTVPEHRDEIALALVTCDNENGRAKTTAASVLHLQREQDP